MYRVAARLDPDCYYRLARAVVRGDGPGRHRRAVGEFHYVHHRPDGGAYDDPGAMGKAVVAAARDAGIRLSLLDTLYLHGGLDPTLDGGYGPLRPEQARFSDGSAERWADRAEELASAVSGPTVRVGAAVHSVRAVDPPSIKVAADWARERGAPLHFHASEQPAENQQCLDVHGMTPTEVIARAGGLGPGTTLVHATHARERDQAMIGEASAYCCLCPTTERDLADGTGPSLGLAQAGAGLCLGSDSHATVDILEEARTVELDQRAATHDRGVFGVEALASMATSGGYRSLGWREGGTLEAGSAGRLRHGEAQLGADGRSRRWQRAGRDDLRGHQRGRAPPGGGGKDRRPRRCARHHRCRRRARRSRPRGHRAMTLVIDNACSTGEATAP